ncbi:neuropeptide F receptor-like [Tubulanus polymorphus]|uniref:neuropeptide F receptor-like n=1 Tax=Tubulanus polymorphus TaxID=672921 RepID=UPI003DA3D966
MTSLADLLKQNSSGGLRFNFSDETAIGIFLEMDQHRHWFDRTTEILLILAYTLLIVFGASGNGLVCFVVARNPHMRTPRNIFIINLAISDLTLCLFTQPFNLVKLLFKEWALGVFMCKFVSMAQGTNVFVSTISITAIALDRFQVIVYPTKDNMKKVGAAVALICIWWISLLMASPLLIFSQVVPFPPNTGQIKLYDVCIENLDLSYAKGSYSIASMIVQYIVPILIVSIAHAKICNKLKYRMVSSQMSGSLTSPNAIRKKEREARRKRRTNILLLTIALVFVLSWLPINILNILLEYKPDTYRYLDSKLMFAICHLLVLSSACTNPVVYGWLNENFRKEFVSVLCCSCCRRLQRMLKSRDSPDRRENRQQEPQRTCNNPGPRMTDVAYTSANTNGASLVVVLDKPAPLETQSEICQPE